MIIEATIRKVLIVEDNPGDFVLIEDYLLERFNNMMVIHADTFVKAQQKLIEEKDVSAVLLDFMLPDLQGFELVEEIQKYTQDAPILVLTGYGDLELAKRVLSKGISDFLIKDELSPDLLYKSLLYAQERKRFTSGLALSKKSYQNLFDFSPQPTWLFETDGFKFLEVNKAAIEKYGYSKAEFLELTLFDIKVEDDKIKLKETLSKNAHDLNSSFFGTFRHQIKDGDIIDVEIYCQDIEYEDRKVKVMLANDITDKLIYIKTIEEQNKRLKQIAWTQSHVVRAPLARMLSLMNLMELEPPQPEQSDFYMNNLRSSLQELDEIIKGIVKDTQALDLKEK